MKHWINRRVVTVFVLGSVLLTGCMTAAERRAAIEKGPTMAAIYRGDVSREALSREQPIGNGGGALGYTRDATNEINQLFPTIKNPEILIFVYPHLRGDLPVPGYTTAIPLYDSAVIYALPGEATQ